MAFTLPRRRYLLPAAFLAGALHVLAFAPINAWVIQFPLLALLFFAALRADRVSTAGLAGWLFGAGWYAAGVSWLFISMHRYGGMPSWMAALAVLLLAAFLGAFTGLAMAAGAWLQRRRGLSEPMMALMVLPALFALSDWLRDWIFTGFPWLVTGYAHTDSPLGGFAPLIGVYGIGWLAALCAGALLLARARRALLILPLLLLAAGAGWKDVAFSTPQGKPITVRLLQGNVAQNLKFDPEVARATLQDYLNMVRAAPADLVVTPETAVPVPSNFLPPDYLEQYAAYAQESGSSVALGIPAGDADGSYANSVFGYLPDGARYRYDKHHLVPFGEFVPFGFRWFVDMMRIPLGDFARGAIGQPAMHVRDQWVQPNICYEDLFGSEIAAQMREAPAAEVPTVLLNLSNIAWFGDSIALPQHLQVSRMRAMELGRPMLRATNTGATAVIRPDGAVQAQLPPFTRGVLTARVQGHGGWTPYARLGDWLAVALWAFMLGAALLSRQVRKSA